MSHPPQLSRDDGDDLFQRFEASFDAPAYVRRARRVEAALEQLLETARHRRDELLVMVRLRFGMLKALAGEWERLRPLLADEAQLVDLIEQHDALQPRLRAPVARTSSPAKLRAALRELNESVERFNRRWSEYLSTIDVAPINALRDGYNKYYVLERECAMRSSPLLARRGFEPLPPLTVDDVAAALPVLPVVALKIV